MRPTTSTMLQQNNNNNYPCLDMSGSTRDVLQKCSRASLPFPSRLELGLGDLPLIRGLRAWALCSRNRRKASGLQGRGQAPTAPPAGRGTSAACPRPADVYLSGDYGLPLGLDARQAGIGALVTVATLKTSLGSGKTQTQCLFLRTEKGSCLYSTAKPSSGVAASGASSMVGEWLRGKKSGGGGGKDAPGAGANRVRVRSGRRWRKSGNAAHREEQQRSCEDPAGELALEERQEERDKAGLDRKRCPSPQQDGRRARGGHHLAPQTCTQHGGRLQRKDGQAEHEGGDGLGRGGSNGPSGEPKEMRRGGQKNEKEEGQGLPEPEPDQQSNCPHRNSHAGCDVEEEGEMSGAERNEGLKMQTSHSQDGVTDGHEETSPGLTKVPTGNEDLLAASDSKSTNNDDMNNRRAESDCCEDARASANGFSGQESEEEMESSSISGGKESSVPVGGSICSPADLTLQLQEDEQNPPEVHQLGRDSGVGFVANVELNVGRIESQQQNFAADEKNSVNEEPDEDEEPRTDVRTPQQEDGDLLRQDHGEGEASQLDLSKKELKKSCAAKDEWRLQEDEDGGKTTGACVQSNPEPSTDVLSVSCVDPLNRNNPTPSLPPLASMATGLPRLEEEEKREEEEEVVGEAAGETQREKRRSRRGQGEEERGSKVATEDGSTQEEEEDEFGGFMQAEGEPAWSQEVNMSASVPCGSRDTTAPGSYSLTGESSRCTPPAFHQSDDSWTAFSQDASHAGHGSVGQWWPSSAVEARTDRPPPHQDSQMSVFAEAFPSPPGASGGDPSGLGAVATLTQLLRGGAGPDQGLLDSFHDLNKMIGQRYKRASGVSRDLLLRTLHLQPPLSESRPALWTTNRRLSPGLPSANQNAQTAAAKRRLSYDYNRNVVE